MEQKTNEKTTLRCEEKMHSSETPVKSIHSKGCDKIEKSK
jgi:hypothetical protein